MTVSYRKASIAGVAYYLHDLDGELIEEGANAVARWWICGSGHAAVQTTLEIPRGRLFSGKDADAFSLLAQGLHPGCASRKLVRNAGSSKRVALHDFTLSVPKSVSVAWALAPPETRARIEEAQWLAAQAFLSLLADFAAITRMGKCGKVHLPCPLVAAMFEHQASRALDPQLHTHCCVLNLTVRSDGQGASIEVRPMLRWLGAAASVYHLVLASQLQALGLRIAPNATLFELADVPQNLCRIFSQRRQEIETSVRESRRQWEVMYQDRPVSRAMWRAHALMTRPAKRPGNNKTLASVWQMRAKDWQQEMLAMFAQAYSRRLANRMQPLEYADIQPEIKVLQQQVRHFDLPDAVVASVCYERMQQMQEMECVQMYEPVRERMA